jgi:hypothetical protein
MKDEQKFNQSRNMFIIGIINSFLIILKALLNLFLFVSSFGLDLENRYSVNFIVFHLDHQKGSTIINTGFISNHFNDCYCLLVSCKNRKT